MLKVQDAMSIEVLKNYQQEVDAWLKITNEYFSLFAFSFALACISLDGSEAVIASIASIIMLTLITWHFAPLRPKALNRLMSKKDKSKEENEFYDFAQNHINKMSKYSPFTFSYCFMWCVFFYSMFPYIKIFIVDLHLS
jgi:hypothetical protein